MAATTSCLPVLHGTANSDEVISPRHRGGFSFIAERSGQYNPGEHRGYVAALTCPAYVSLILGVKGDVR